MTKKNYTHENNFKRTNFELIEKKKSCAMKRKKIDNYSFDG